MSNLKNRVERIERQSGSRLRVLMETNAEEALEKRPKRPGEVVVVLTEEDMDL